MEQAGKLMVIGGVALTLLGGLLWIVGRAFPDFRPGRLPGDIVVEKPGLGFYFPITTMIIVSLVLTLIVWLVSLVKR